MCVRIVARMGINSLRQKVEDLVHKLLYGPYTRVSVINLSRDREASKLLLFTLAIQHELNSKAHKGSWADHDIEEKLRWLREEVNELEDSTPDNVLEEASQVALCAMIIADHYGVLKVT